MSNTLPRAAILLTARIVDFGRWYETFNQAEPLRRRFGILGHHVNRYRGDENRLSVYFALENVEGGENFLRSEELKAVMKRAGVEGTPKIAWLKPRSEDIVWDRELPAFMVRHVVKDFLHWKKMYEAAAAIRTKSGIIGHAANTLLDDERTVIVYHQAESFATLDTFLADPDLKAAMDLAGVTGEPEVTFAIGGWSKRYASSDISPEVPTATHSTSTQI